MLGKDEKLLFSSTCIMDNYIYTKDMIVPTKFIVSIYKNILRLESGTIVRKNLIIVPFFDFKVHKNQKNLYDYKSVFYSYSNILINVFYVFLKESTLLNEIWHDKVYQWMSRDRNLFFVGFGLFQGATA